MKPITKEIKTDNSIHYPFRFTNCNLMKHSPNKDLRTLKQGKPKQNILNDIAKGQFIICI